MAEDDLEKLSLTTIKDGAAVEMFDNCLDQVLQNIADINTNLKDREIKLTVKIKPSKDRSFIAYAIFCDPKLQSQEPEAAMAMLRLDNRGRSYAVVQKKQQGELPFTGNITPIRKGTGEENAESAV